MGTRTRLATLFAGLTITALVAATGLGLAGRDVAAAESNGGVRLMPLGDSITDGFTVAGGYRVELWQRLVAGGYSVDFVGSQYNGPAELGDHDHEGFTGWRIDQIDAQVVSWLTTYQPRTVMLQIGTNDILHNYDPANAPSRLSTLLDHILGTLPGVELFVATLTPLTDATYEAGVVTFNAAVPGIVSAKAAAGYHTHLVNMHAVLTTADLSDGIHPTAAGYAKMGDAWYDALRAVPSSLQGTTASPTASPTATKTASPTASPTSSPTASPTTSATTSATAGPTTSAGARTCTATYRVTGSWPGGFQGEVTVTAGSAAIAGWTVTWTFSSGQTVTQSWSATVTSSGTAYSATNVAYNGALAAGGSTAFGFIGTYATTNPTPVLTCTAR